MQRTFSTLFILFRKESVYIFRSSNVSLCELWIEIFTIVNVCVNGIWIFVRWFTLTMFATRMVMFSMWLMMVALMMVVMTMVTVSSNFTLLAND